MSEELQLLNRDIERARILVRRDPVAALAAAEEATRLSESIARRGSGDARKALELRGLAWAYRGNALRVTGDLSSADGAFERAAETAAELDSRFVTARHSDLLASLRFAQERHEEAFALLEGALAAYRALEADHALGRALLKKAHFLISVERGDEVVPLLRDALEAIPAHRDPESFCLAATGLVYALDQLGYTVAACGLLASLKRFRRQQGDDQELLRLRWTETRLMRSVGGERRAEEALRELQNDFLAADLPFETVRISLELAGLYIDQGRHFDLRRLSLSLFPLFQNRQLGREAMAALIHFRERLATGPLDRETIRDLDEYFALARNETNRRFEPRRRVLAAAS